MTVINTSPAIHLQGVLPGGLGVLPGVIGEIIVPLEVLWYPVLYTKGGGAERLEKLVRRLRWFDDY